MRPILFSISFNLLDRVIRRTQFSSLFIPNFQHQKSNNVACPKTLRESSLQSHFNIQFSITITLTNSSNVWPKIYLQRDSNFESILNITSIFRHGLWTSCQINWRKFIIIPFCNSHKNSHFIKTIICSKNRLIEERKGKFKLIAGLYAKDSSFLIRFRQIQF